MSAYSFNNKLQDICQYKRPYEANLIKDSLTRLNLPHQTNHWTSIYNDNYNKVLSYLLGRTSF